MKILILDDEFLIRSSLRLYIERFGIPHDDIIEISRASELAACLAKEHIDVAFIDVRMPGTDGLSAIEQCLGLTSDTSIYIISGYSNFEYAHRALRLHVSDYLLKPISPDEVHRILQKEMDRLSSQDSVRDSLTALSSDSSDVLSSIRCYIDLQYSEDISVGRLSQLFGLSPNYLSSTFKQRFGIGIIQYLTDVRLTHACNLLVNSDLSVQDIAVRCGYDDPAYFSKVFQKAEQMTPGQYRKISRKPQQPALQTKK